MEITKFVVSGRDQAKLYGDYATYRTQLSNRIQNLRRKLGVATKKPPAKYTKKEVTAEDIGRDHEYVQSVEDICLAHCLIRSNTNQICSSTAAHVRTCLGTCYVYEGSALCRQARHHRLESIAHHLETTQGYCLRKESIRTPYEPDRDEGEH